MSEIPTEGARYRVLHETEYVYATDVSHAHQMLHLMPREHEMQVCHDYSLTIDPIPTTLREMQDCFGNRIVQLELATPHRTLLVAAEMDITVSPRPPIDARESQPWNKVRDQLAYSARPRAPHDVEAASFRMESPHVRLKRAVVDFARDCFPRNQPILACADTLLTKLHRELEYAPLETHIGTSVTDLLETRRGVCQDFSHLMVACIRAQGLAARYVSGYLRTNVPDGQERLVGADASHAWISIYAPPFGWVDYDPTNGVRVGADHITLAWGRDFSDVSPLRGVIVGGGAHQVAVRVTVEKN